MDMDVMRWLKDTKNTNLARTNTAPCLSFMMLLFYKPACIVSFDLVSFSCFFFPTSFLLHLLITRTRKRSRSKGCVVLSGYGNK